METVKVRFKVERFTENRTLGLNGLKSFVFENLGKVRASFQFETEEPSELDPDSYVSIDAGAGAKFEDGNYNVQFYPVLVERDALGNIIYPEGYAAEDLDLSDGLTIETATRFKFRSGDRYIKLTYTFLVL